MYNDPSLTLADQLALRVETFLKGMGGEAYRRRLGVLSIAIWQRVRGFVRRFTALYAAWKAGTLPKARAVRAAVRAAAPPVKGAGEVRAWFDPLAPGLEIMEAARTRPGSLLPRRFGWLHTMLPETGPPLAGVVGMILDAHPEIRQFVAEVPQVGRVLRPMCAMLGMTVPDYLALPKRNRGVAHPSPDPSRKGRGTPKKRRTPREVAAAAIEKALRTGKPVDPRKIGAVAFGYVLHWPRDGNCPPPEVGYGGKAFPNTPKDYVPPKG